VAPFCFRQSTDRSIGAVLTKDWCILKIQGYLFPGRRFGAAVFVRRKCLKRRTGFHALDIDST